MRVRYVFPLSRPLEIDDHWPIPLLGGECRLVENNGVITAIEYTKAGLSTDLAFAIERTPHEKSKLTITGKDDFLIIVRDHLRRAFSYLQCFFDTDRSFGDVEIYHEAESPDEIAKIDVSHFQYGRKERGPLPLSFDMVTRSLMAAADHEGPEFISSLIGNAREAGSEKRHIDAFRFAFLLVEALFGGGKFKSKQLTAEFLASSQLTTAIQRVIDDWKTRPVITPSETLTLMDSGPTVEQVVAHLVEMRGHYFHGNLAKKHPWHPSKQEEADAIAWLAVSIAQLISTDAAAEMFAEEYTARHFDDAGAVGAHVLMKITYHYRVPEDDFIHRRRLNFRISGTKPTTNMAMEAAYRSLENFKHGLPIGRLHSVMGNDAASGAEVFFIRFCTEPDGKVVDD